jgi:hypothetical protein
MVLNVWLGAHLQEIHCCCQQKVCSVNGLIMRGLWSTKDSTPSGTSQNIDAKVLGNVAWALLHGEMVCPPL